MENEKFIKKIESLGQREKVVRIKRSSSVDSGNGRELNRYKLPSIYLELGHTFGSFSFERWIKAKSIESIPISENGYVSVDGFYAVEDAIQLFSEYKEQIPTGMVPISDGEPGDLICIGTEGEKNGRVYYWHHESPRNHDIYLLANNLEQLILNLEIYEEESEESGEGKLTKAHLSQKILNMLKRDGYGRTK